MSTLESSLREIAQRRQRILEDFLRAWTASNVPDEKLDPRWFINNVELVEQTFFDPSGPRVVWTVRFKEKPNA